jgi:hypothetical protein
VYTDTLCKDLLGFTNIETFVACDVKLSTDLWIQFAQNSKCLKKLTFKSSERVVAGYADELRFGASYIDDKPPKNAALDAIVKIPTLKHLSFDNVNMRYFPPGPSGIESLYLNVVDVEKYAHFEKFRYNKKDQTKFISHWENLGFSRSFDLSGHQNLKDVTIEYIDYIKFSDLQLEKLENLESFALTGYFKYHIEDKEDAESLKAIFKLPSFKMYNKIVIPKPITEQYCLEILRSIDIEKEKQRKKWPSYEDILTKNEN